MKALLLLVVLVACLAVEATAQSAEDLFQQALRVERVSGNTEAAIELYGQIVSDHATERAVVARALLQIGKAYEILGRDGARDAYTRIVDEYGDFASVASEAAERIAAFRRLEVPAITEARSPGSSARIVLEAEEQNSLWGAGMSPDGKYIVRGRSILQHIESGAIDSMAAMGTLCQGSGRARFSPSGDRIAFNCHLDENSGVAVYDRDTRSAKLIFNVGDYFGATPEERVYQGVYDWSNDGSSVLIAAGMRNPEDATRNAGHLLLVPVSGGTPTVIDDDTSKSEFWGNQACLLRDGRFMFGEYGHNSEQRAAIHAVDTQTGQHVSVLSDNLASMQLYDCVPQTNALIYGHKLFGTSETLFAATVSPTGEIGAPRLLANLPEGSGPVPGARDGNVYYFEYGPTSFVAVADVDTLRGQAVSNFRVVKEGQFRLPRWSPDGNYLIGQLLGNAMIEGFNGLESTTWSHERHLGYLIWSPDGSQLISSNRPTSNRFRYAGTEVLERHSGEVIHQVPDLAAVAWLPDASGFYYVAKEGDQKCLSTYTFASGASKEVFCLDPEMISAIPAIPERNVRFEVWETPPGWSPGWSLSPDGSTFAYWGSEMTEKGQGRPLFLLDTATWEMKQAVDLIHHYPQISWSGDSKSLYVYGDQNNVVRAYNLVREEWADWPLGEMGPNKYWTVAIHPSGTQVAVFFAAWLWKPEGTTLSVLHQPPGLLEAR